MAVTAPQSNDIQLETVSSRLKGELIHPNKNAGLAGLEFSPDGKRLLAGDYPGGTIAMWELASGKRLTTLEASYGTHASSRYFAVSPDWRTVFAWREKRKYERVEQDGKHMIRWTFGGEVRAWNLEDGKLIRTYKREPQSNVRLMRLAPDGKSFYTLDQLPGTYEGGAKQTLTLWNVKTGVYRTMEGLDGIGTFSPDGKTLALTVRNEDGYARGLKLIDTVKGTEKWSVPITEKNDWCNVGAFSRDGRLIFGTKRRFERSKKWDHWQMWMKWWDAATGEEVASFEGDKDDSITDLQRSPDGKTLAALNWRGDKRKLFLFDVAQKRLIRTILLGEKPADQELIATGGAFSPDGKWLTVIIRVYPEKRTGDVVDPRDLPQPRILLIETSTGAIRETLISPQCFADEAIFSPDGRTMATSGHGRVLLWDMTKMPR